MNASTALCPLSQRYTYHVLTAAACMPASNKFGVYLHDRLNVGKTEACAYSRALARAKEQAEQLRSMRASEAIEDAGEIIQLRAVA